MTLTHLSPQQLHALFDILTHHQTYNEIQKFKDPKAIQNYGPPFDPKTSSPSSSPILQTLLYRFVLELPGVKDVTPDFWEKRCQSLVEKLAAAELSESYDKGTIGSRRTLATAISTLLEYPARGVYGGLGRKIDNSKAPEEYDLSEPEDVLEAWDAFAQELVHGEMIEHIFATIAETDKLEEQTSLVQAAHEYLVINLASFLHYTMVLSPDGPYIARVTENINKLVPYGLIRQTLKIGNAASMINGMLKLLLTKLSVNSITSYFRLTNYSDDGMNLLQQIASTVITWDVSELQKQTTKIEKENDGPSKDHVEAIKGYMKKTRKEREQLRLASQKDNKSIVAAIFADSGLPVDITDAQHAQALDYFSIQLSIRDRDELSKVICYSQPDLITQSVRDIVSAYDPILRKVHSTVDLSASLTDFENFMADLVKLSRSVNGSDPSHSEPPSVVEFVQLLRKHQGASHRFMHQVAKKCPDVTHMYKEYVQSAAAQFRSETNQSEKPTKEPQLHSDAGSMSSSLQKMFTELPDESRQTVVDALDNQSAYLFALFCASRDRMRSAIEDDTKAPTGPGLYLPKWQQLLDSTPITPATLKGPVRNGRDSSVKEKNGGVGVERTAKSAKPLPDFLDSSDIPNPPDVGKVVELFGPKFHDLIAEKGKKLWTS
ncbi:hypothetical protein EJ08DRAFT_584187 [Tothia fuscella]|uniref:Uncharacterized protein n=1 Tax=Tothia fuscella TaxID=1048955 RepID=A0A9P4NVQ3_9PEZI|nr:hypothetical protein EJ08DRAFT_584187 [Tothia fuscella]